MENDIHFLKLAFNQAKESFKKGGFPAGAIVVRDGQVVGKGLSLGGIENDPTGHAETNSIRETCKNLKTVNLEGATLYANLQPCLMCFSAASWAGISKIVYGCRKDKVSDQCYEGSSAIEDINSANRKSIELSFIPSWEEKSIKLVKQWEELQK
jgi:tRNA(Arg) A34 adenosine deaminase TadA